MKSTRYFTNILLISCFIFLSSCSGLQKAPTMPPSMPTISTTPSARNLEWLQDISDAEALWASNNITSYELVGRMRWAWHVHSFQVTVANGEIVSSRCESVYDNLTENHWCETEFDANDHTIPALFERTRELLKAGYGIASPQTECFIARFDFNIGIPNTLSFDCPKAHDEEEDWTIIFFNNMP